MSRRVLVLMCVAVLAATGAVADDGEKVTKSMSHTIEPPPLEVYSAYPAVASHVPEAEHAFTDMMKFYVPMQSASGTTSGFDPAKDPTQYLDIDGNWVETLVVAKPLVNVFIYGPAIGVDGTAFAHSFMDTYAAVSLDDGVTWKDVNLSGSAHLTSFNLDEDHLPAEPEPMPGTHTILLGSQNNGAFHAPGYEIPYTAHCTECHGRALTGSAIAPSCYSCHGSRWKEEAPANIGPVVYEAVYKNDKLQGSGENADPYPEVDIINGLTGEVLFTENVTLTGTFSFVFRPNGLPPCTVAGSAGGETGPAIAVTDKDGVPLVEGEQCQGMEVDITEYPGGAYNVFHATAGNRTLVAWPSRFCEQGQPAYSIAWDGDDEGLSEDQLAKRDALVELFSESYSFSIEEDLYLTDLFGVAGAQRSIDFADEGYPQAGVVPFGCVWTARGVLLPGDDPRTEDQVEESHMVWTKAERLTSGRRDPNRIEVKGVAGAGFVITWQEDPDGLRPGQGLGPGEGWSGAVAHDKTDVWYSFIPWEYFDLVENPDDPAGDPVNVADHDLLISGRPQVYVPMAVPMRLTNNDKCQADEYGPGQTPSENKVFSYCNEAVAAAYGLQDFCVDTVDIPLGPEGAPGPICVNEDGLPNIANTGSTRPRTSLQGRDEDGDGIADGAWVIVAAEESKGLGRFAFTPDGAACDELPPDDPAYNPDCGADIGKNQWYFSFDMGSPDTSATMSHENGLVQNLVSQGNMLNQPEVDWRTGEFYPAINTLDMWDFSGDGGDYNFDIYNTEIARRSSLLVQSIGKAAGSSSGVLVISSWKQGAMRQGGPADVMFRRIVLPDPEAYSEDGIETNPYAFINMECEDDNWLVLPDTNPYYPKGVCGAPATNLSSVVPDTCIDTATDGDIPCPTVTFDGTTFGIGDTNPILQGYIQGEGNTQKILTWHQCPSDGVAQDTGELEGEYFGCDTDARTDTFVNLKDQSWYNPLDVAKGHRGFLDGDFVMFLYAWSPNWRLNAKGNDRYDLYVRRSFDGGVTWQTTPAEGTASDGVTAYAGDGTVTCETYRSTVTQTPEAPEPHVCYDYPAGGNEQARNITQHSRMRITTLDPRYAPTAGSIADGCIDALALPDTVDASLWTCDDGSTDYDSDLRDPSRYFMVFETGDNTTVEVGEAEPLDLYYSRAESFGDDYVVWTETDTGYDDPDTACYPTVAHDDEGIIGTVIEGSGFCNEFDRMNSAGDTHSSEANLEANPDGSKMYGVWAQWVFDDLSPEEIAESDATARRIWWIDDYRSDNDDLTWTLPGTNQPTTP